MKKSYDEIHNTGQKLIFCDFNKGDSQRTYSQTMEFSELIKEITSVCSKNSFSLAINTILAAIRHKSN